MKQKLFFDGTIVRDGDNNGVVVRVKANSVKVYFEGQGVVDYLTPMSARDILPEGVKTANDLQCESGSQKIGLLLLQLFLAKKDFSIQEGTITVLEEGVPYSMPAKNMQDLLDALESIL